MSVTAFASFARHPLSFALGTMGRMATLRVLSLIDEPLTQREVARRAHLQHRTVQLALDDLVGCGVVTRIVGGRDYLVRMNHQHRLADPLAELFRTEAEHFLELRRALVDAVGGGRPSTHLLSLVIFGSVARSEDRLDSDLDVLLIARTEEARLSGLDRLGAARDGLGGTFGLNPRPIGYTIAEARRLWSVRRAPITEAERDGIVLLGPPLSDLLGGAG